MQNKLTIYRANLNNCINHQTQHFSCSSHVTDKHTVPRNGLMVCVASVAQSIQPHTGIKVEVLGYFITKVKVQSIPENMY